MFRTSDVLRGDSRTGACRVAATITLVAAAGVDLAFGRAASPTVTLVFAPFVASALLPPRDTAAFGVVAVIGAFVLGWPDGTTGTTVHVVRTIAVALGAFLAHHLARERVRREVKLIAVTTVAEAAQQAILHPLPAELGPLRLAGRYVSATSEARVGGDFYDVLSTPFGVRLVVGDVRGKGLDAVRLASLLLGEFRSRAVTDTDLAEVVSRLDAVARASGGSEDFATAILAEVRNDTITLVRCGHPQPLLRSKRTVEELDLWGTFPLGLGADGTHQTLLPMSHGEQVLVFSDGAIETHDDTGHDFDVALAFREAPPDPQGAVQHLLDELHRHAAGMIADDVILIVAEARSWVDPAEIQIFETAHGAVHDRKQRDD